MKQIQKISKTAIIKIVENETNPYKSMEKVYKLCYGEYLEQALKNHDKLALIEGNQALNDFVDSLFIDTYGKTYRTDNFLCLLKYGFRTNKNLGLNEVLITI